MKERTYIAIDLKSFFASVECQKRGLDPLTTNLVVADITRTEKTICLAVTPSLKSFGIPGRPRLFEVIQKVKEVNKERRMKIPSRTFRKKSTDYNELISSLDIELDYIVAIPHMADYIKYSTRIYDIYLKYIAPEDIHVYSIDEVFIDVTHYLKTYQMSARELAMTLIQDVLKTTGITATAGIGTNLYLSKVAMDIVAKKMPADNDGVRIAELDEMTYRKLLWNHQPLTDFWRVGNGYRKKLEALGLYTMGDIARYSLYDEDRLYEIFGINAELLIDHAWGYESATIQDIKRCKPHRKSLSSGQVLQDPYPYEKAKIVVKEMTDLLVLDLVEKGFVTDQIVLTVGYDIESLTRPEISQSYRGPITTDMYGRKVPKHAHGTINLDRKTSSTKLISEAVVTLFERIVNKRLLVRRMYVVASRLSESSSLQNQKPYEQLDLFTDYDELKKQREQEEEFLRKENNLQLAILNIKNKYGKNAIIKGMNLEEGATTIERNQQIGGHKA